jgi:S-(hydroxymethyl)glutathione dehydrogenase / alcohol dehydrogenase
MSVQASVAVLPPGQDTLELETVELPGPGPWEVAIKQKAFGICHSQLDVIDRRRTEPLVIGHESTGVVTATGSEVTHVRAGDEVLLTWIPRSPELSRKPGASRVPLPDGRVAVTHNVFAWATHVLADEQYVVRAPDGVPADLASIIGCAIMTGSGSVLNTAGDVAGRSVAVWGVGGVGLAAVASAHALGASPVIAVDINDEKLDVARAMGADQLVNALSVDAAVEVRALTKEGSGVDYSFDCTGRGDNVQKSLAAVRPGVPGRNRGGTLVLVGAPRAPFEFNGMELLAGQKGMLGTLGGDCLPERDFPVFAQWFRAGQLDLDALVTNRYSLDQVNHAVDDLRTGKVLGRAIVEL